MFRPRHARTLVSALLIPIVLVGCKPDVPRQEARVDPVAHDAFYLWPGVRPAANLHPRTLYLLDGEVRKAGAPRFERLRMGVPHLPGTAVWLVVRTERLDWDAATYAALLGDLERWHQAGNRVMGLQVDFDAATSGIARYAEFLTDLRQRLPRRWQLSVTGLMDWSAHGNPGDLVRLGSVIDEVVVQTYQDRSTIPGYEAYFRRMENFPIPFRVALVEGGTWQAPPMLANQRLFRGYVIFLIRSEANPSDVAQASRPAAR
jgi:hypothetical protein